MDQGDAHQISRAEGDLDKHTAAEKKQREAACLQVVCREKAAAPYIPISTVPTPCWIYPPPAYTSELAHRCIKEAKFVLQFVPIRISIKGFITP